MFQHFCFRQFEQSPNFASTFKLKGPIDTPIIKTPYTDPSMLNWRCVQSVRIVGLSLASHRSHPTQMCMNDEMIYEIHDICTADLKSNEL